MKDNDNGSVAMRMGCTVNTEGWVGELVLLVSLVLKRESNNEGKKGSSRARLSPLSFSARIRLGP